MLVRFNSSNSIEHVRNCKLSKKDFIISIEELHPTAKKAINALLKLQSKYVTVQASQSLLGAMCGCTREWANKLLAGICEGGFLTMTYRHRMTCVYELHPYFFDNELMSQLAKHFVMYIGNLFPQAGYALVRRFQPQFTPYIYYKEDITSKKGYLTVKQEDSYIRESFTARWMSLLVETFLSTPSKKSKYQKFHAYETSYDDRPVFGSEFY